LLKSKDCEGEDSSTRDTKAKNSVANFERIVPFSFIGDGGFSVTNEFLEYIKPILYDELKFYPGLEMIRL
jgi:hypothetical protein